MDHEKIRAACLRPAADAYNLTIYNYMSTAIATTLDNGAVPNKSPYSEGAECPFYTYNPSLRLMKTFNGLLYTGKVHETVVENLLSFGKTIGELDAVIHHYGKLNKERQEYKAEYYFTLARHEAEKKPADKRNQFNLLQQALAAGQWETALEAAKTTIKFNLGVEPLVLYGAGLALHNMDRHEEAIGYLDLLLKQNPLHALGILCKGASCEALGNVNGGRELIMKAINLLPSYVPSYISLSNLELRLNNFDAARKTVLDAMSVAPTEPALYDILMKIELTRGNRRQAIQDAMRGIKLYPNGGEGRWHRLAAVCLCQDGEIAAAKSMVELGLRTFPNDPDLTRLKGII
jgi:tetratricopeptide (TPR) repeat protein